MLTSCVVVLAALFLQSTPNRLAQVPTSVPLEKAQQEGLVAVQVLGVGGSSGDVISIMLQRKSRTPLRLTLARGTVLLSSSASIQNMLAIVVKGQQVTADVYRPTAVMELLDEARHAFLVEAYCLDFEKENEL